MTLTDNQKVYLEDIAWFIRARLEEEREIAEAAYGGLDEFSREWVWGRGGFGGLVNRAGTRSWVEPTPDSRLINLFSPKRVHAEIGYKYTLVTAALLSDDWNNATVVLRPLAEIWHKHEDYGKWGVSK